MVQEVEVIKEVVKEVDIIKKVSLCMEVRGTLCHSLTLSICVAFCLALALSLSLSLSLSSSPELTYECVCCLEPSLSSPFLLPQCSQVVEVDKINEKVVEIEKIV